MYGARYGKLNLIQNKSCIVNGEEWNETLGQKIISIEKEERFGSGITGQLIT